MNRLCIVFFLCLIPSALLLAQNTHEDKFNEAVLLHSNGDYTAAIEIFEDLSATDYYSPELYLNMAICYQNMGDNASAIWACATCLKHRPLHQNCKTLFSELTDDIDSYQSAIPSFVLNRWFVWMSSLLSSWLWALLSILLAMGSGALIYQKRKLGYWLIIPFAVVMLLGMKRAQMERFTHFAIVLNDNIELFEGPDKMSTVVYPIEAGTSVEILENYDGFIQVKLLNLDRGWISEDAVRRLR
jgi:tetratricopeptide (TPR) repeat protein